jgi:uncharacterized protein (TIGR00369 family)
MSEAAEKQPPSDEELLARFQRSRNRPRSSETLGFEMLSLNQGEGRVEIAFEGKPDFTNPMGQIQGGFLTAMLDEALSIAGQVASGMTHVMSTLEMKTSFLRPALPGRLRAIGRVVRQGRTVIFLEGEVRDADGKVCATATATALPVEYKSRRG